MTRNAQSFLVRLWPEGDDDSGEWRGEVVHVTGGTSEPIEGPHRIEATIRALMGLADPAEENDGTDTPGAL